MTAREMIDSLSGTLLCDDRILSVPERELLANLLQRTRTQSSAAENAVAEAITRTVGDLIAERALGVLGESMTRQLLQQQSASSSSFPNHSVPVIRAGGTPPTPPAPAPGSAPRPPNASQQSITAGGTPPTNPAPAPGSAPRPPNASQQSIAAGGTPPTNPAPAPGSAPRPPNASQQSITAGGTPPTNPAPSPGSAPRPPNASQSIHAGGTPPTNPAPSPGSAPRPPNASQVTQPKSGGVAVLETSDYVSAECVVLDEFLTSAELNTLRQYVLDQEMQFVISEVVSPGVAGGTVDYEHRRSRVLMDLGGHERMILDRLPTFLPRVLQKWGRDPFPISHVETQTTASNHGDFFRCHSDNSAEEVASREVTFVYFFHREPKQFSGGELRIYDSRRENDNYVPTANYRTIVPEQNQLVLFASGLSHEITPVDCTSGQFVDSRFTINGWVHR
jgi:SM-20-related protein